MAEFVLVAPVLLVLLITIADFGRLFATGIAIESAARDAAEVAAQEYLRDLPAGTPGDPAYYQAIHAYAVDTVCKELRDLPNADFASGECMGIPTSVCVHDGEDPACDSIAPPGVSTPPQCGSFAGAALPSNAQAGGTEASRYVEVRVCYRFSTLFRLPSIGGIGLQFGDFFLERARVFTVADY